MNNPKISVIIPIYNIEEYLEDTLNCLLKQSIIDDMEVLMIDDGSSDNSRYIIEKYALDYDNFYAFHKENTGVANSRNVAIDLAKGEYIQFLDSDDLISPDGYENLYDLAKKNDSDIVSSYMVRLKRYNIRDSQFFIKGYKNISESLDSVDLNDYPELLWDTFSTNKLFKREFIKKNNLKFEPISFYEDVPFGLESLLLADKISIYDDIFYYWRIRERNNPSITQQYSNINNFRDRIKMIFLCNEIIERENLNEKLKNELYSRWVDYDLNIYLRIFYQYDEKYHPEIIEKTRNVLNIVPKEIIDHLNSTKKILYKMVENEDTEGLVNFSKCIPDLMKDPNIPDNLDEEYKGLIDFESDAQKENLNVKASEIRTDEENIFINFTERINYLNENHPHETKATLIDENNVEYPLELNENLIETIEDLKDDDADDLKSKEIIIPLSLISNKEHSRIKIEYITQDLKKEAYLRNSRRDAISYDDFDLEIGIERNGIFFMSIRPTSDLTVDIENIVFEDEAFSFYGVSNKEIGSVYIENLISTKKIEYPIISEKIENGFNIRFSIPYEDILSEAVRKWEIKVANEFKSIKVARKFEFYRQLNKIYIINARNKLLISDDFHNILETLDEKNERNIDLSNKLKVMKKENRKIKNENKKLMEDKSSLENENEKLNKEIENYKSRFAVQSSDKIKRIFKKQ